MKEIFLFKSIYKEDEGYSKFSFEIDIDDRTISMTHLAGKAPHVSDIVKAISLKSDFILNLYKKRKYDFYVYAKRSSIGTTYLSLFYQICRKAPCFSNGDIRHSFPKFFNACIRFDSVV